MAAADPLFTLVALHGNGGGGFRFARTAEYMSRYVRFEAPTLPGFARAPARADLNSIEKYAYYVQSVVVAELPRPRVLLGHGIGGSIALEYVQHFPAEIDGLILHAPVGARLDKRRFPKLMKPRFMRRLGQTVFASPFFRPALKRALFHERVPASYLNEFFREYKHCETFGDWFDWISPDWFAGLEPRDTPAVLLWGEMERVLSADHIRDYQALLPDAAVHTEPEWDHFPMIEQPEQYADRLYKLGRKLVFGAEEE